MLTRRTATLGLLAAGGLGLCTTPAAAADPPALSTLTTWCRLVLELVRHTPTYSPPVASRAFGYLGVTAYEALATGQPDMASLARQLNGLAPLPARDRGPHDEAAVLNAALARAVNGFFGNTGPTGQRAMAAMERALTRDLAATLPADVLARSSAHGGAVATAVLDWSASDGGAVVENMGFPASYTPVDDPAHWVPTSRIVQQQAPLLPRWGANRPFAMPQPNACPLPPPPAYSEAEGSAFLTEAMEVYRVTTALTDEQRRIARFWSDDPMLSPTPPGHWLTIALDILARDGHALPRAADVLARLGIAMADAFIGCWHSKYQYDLVRPVTYINRLIDPDWTPLLITPPFPEYPSGHSTQSGAAAAILEATLGPDVAFIDTTHEADGLPGRSFPSFWAAAEEAAISRLYGGIHFRAAIDRGLAQGRCIARHAATLETLAG